MPKKLKKREDDDWVFLAMFRCERCERSVTWKHGGGDGFDPRGYRSLRVCQSCAASAT